SSDKAAAEGHDAAAQVVNRKQQTAAEAWRDRAVVAAALETGFEQHRFVDPERAHRLAEAGATWGEAESQRTRLLRGDVARREIAARDAGVGGILELPREPVMRRRHRREQRLARIGTGPAAPGGRDPHAAGGRPPRPC